MEINSEKGHTDIYLLKTDSAGLVYSNGLNQFITNQIILSISPNPFITSTTLSYTLDKLSKVNINIFNPQGQLIEKFEQEQRKGEQQILWNAEGLPAGMYYFRIQAGDKVGAGKIVKMR